MAELAPHRPFAVDPAALHNFHKEEETATEEDLVHLYREENLEETQVTGHHLAALETGPRLGTDLHLDSCEIARLSRSNVVETSPRPAVVEGAHLPQQSVNVSARLHARDTVRILHQERAVRQGVVLTLLHRQYQQELED